MKTEILPVDSQNPSAAAIAKAARIIKAGGLVAFPTETVYGLGADFFNAEAVARLAAIKERPPHKPFTVHIAQTQDLARFECEISALAREFIERYWPGPLTLIFGTRAAGKLGFRFPNDKVAGALIRESGTLIAAPSANISGQHAPTNAHEIVAQLDGKIDMIIDAGETTLRKESTIVDVTVFPYLVIREGALPRRSLAEAEADFWKAKVAPTIKKVLFVCTGNSCRSPFAEGYLKKRLREIERDDIHVFSRGTSTSGGIGATPETLTLLREADFDLRSHISRRLTDVDMREADLVLVMEEYHRAEVLSLPHAKKDRVYL
ncbi:MAG: L-threonylcarbamoyladenylate synthase, partial [Candidatus Omnitrophota bacterium]